MGLYTPLAKPTVWGIPRLGKEFEQKAAQANFRDCIKLGNGVKLAGCIMAKKNKSKPEINRTLSNRERSATGRVVRMNIWWMIKGDKGR
jgi:hypothetical protein